MHTITKFTKRIPKFALIAQLGHMQKQCSVFFQLSLQFGHRHTFFEHIQLTNVLTCFPTKHSTSVHTMKHAFATSSKGVDDGVKMREECQHQISATENDLETV